ncbi:MAG: hypothetical protein ACR2NF_04460, partial [Pirellulales bacterium]
SFNSCCSLVMIASGFFQENAIKESIGFPRSLAVKIPCMVDKQDALTSPKKSPSAQLSRGG